MSALITDFERYLSDEPVAAYPDPWTTRAARWIKRHKTLVVAAATGLLMATVISAIAVALLVDVNRDLSAEKRESEVLRGRAETALEEATANLYSHTIGLAHAEFTKNNVVRARELLEQCPPALRHWEWYYLMSAIEQHAPAQVLREHTKSVYCIEFSPDQQLVATSGTDGQVILRRAVDLHALRRFDFGGEVRAVAFSHDEQRLWVGGLL